MRKGALESVLDAYIFVCIRLWTFLGCVWQVINGWFGCETATCMASQLNFDVGVCHECSQMNILWAVDIWRFPLICGDFHWFGRFTLLLGMFFHAFLEFFDNKGFIFVFEPGNSLKLTRSWTYVSYYMIATTNWEEKRMQNSQSFRLY